MWDSYVRWKGRKLEEYNSNDGTVIIVIVVFAGALKTSRRFLE